MIFSLLVHSSVIAVSHGEADSETDLSAEKNFLRFKKEINHALPGESFFRSNFDQPHPDHGKGGVLRPIGREVIQTTPATSFKKFSKSSGTTNPFRSTIASSNVLPYQPRHIQVNSKADPRKEKKYKNPSSTQIINDPSKNEYRTVHSDKNIKQSTVSAISEPRSTKRTFASVTKGEHKFGL